jgi:hypothetical protein
LKPGVYQQDRYGCKYDGCGFQALRKELRLAAALLFAYLESHIVEYELIKFQLHRKKLGTGDIEQGVIKGIPPPYRIKKA